MVETDVTKNAESVQHKPYSLFSVIGLELEYMLVNQVSLDINPCSDAIMEHFAGKVVNDTPLGEMTIGNELVMHVIELKNHQPVPPSVWLVEQFQKTIQTVQAYLHTQHLTLLPTAAHPWMDPLRETKRWPHGDQIIYQTYDKIFNCKGHGWANLQSVHVNLPFADDAEFNILHNGIRLLLPLLPALAASSPILDQKITGYLDTRLHFYNQNQSKLPMISGDIIPEYMASKAQYQREILEPMYQAIAPFDKKAHLQYEWLNSRGAIPKFAYNAVEIRLLDSQECVLADASIAFAIFHILKALAEESDSYLHHPLPTASLKSLYQASLKQGLQTPIEDATFLKQLRLPSHLKTIREVWMALLSQYGHLLDKNNQTVLDTILTQGNLSERILKAVGKTPTRPQLQTVYTKLNQCLLNNTLFLP